ncbi:MAG: major capsid protein [Microvirus sp.]|nr:MAG: major capsid protein [Microvirus sp.]
MSDVAVHSQQGPARNNAFQSVAGHKSSRSTFDLSHDRKLTADFGQLIPSMFLEMVPGDTFEISNDLAVRFQPLLAPILHQVDASIHYFFVPTRLCWPKIGTSGDDWETFITGGVSGTNAAVAPRWNVSSGKHDVGSLWDYFGLPTWSAANNFSTQFPDATQPLDFARRSYNLIYNEWYRDETLQSELVIGTSEDVQVSGWTKDFFTSALPWQQRGTAPAFSLGGSTSAIYPGDLALSRADGANLPVFNPNASPSVTVTGAGVGASNIVTKKAVADVNTVSFSAATTFNLNDFRLNTVIQRLLERNARGGVRYTEFLQNVHGCHPRDERLQRPEYIGGVRQPVIVSEVLQTSASNAQPTPQGNMAGHGLSVGRNFAGKYTAVEFGYVIGIFRVMPVPAYQQGIPRAFLRTSKYDFFVPEFVGLGEQAVENQELYLANDAANKTTFGYQGRYNELRYERNTVHGLFQSTLNYWHLGRIFASRPALNGSFISLSATELTSLKRIFVSTSQPGLLCSIGNNVKAIRPLPVLAEPGLHVI